MGFIYFLKDRFGFKRLYESGNWIEELPVDDLKTIFTQL